MCAQGIKCKGGAQTTANEKNKSDGDCLYATNSMVSGNIMSLSDLPNDETGNGSAQESISYDGS